MNATFRTRWGRWTTRVALAVLSLAVASGAARADGCEPVNGTFASHVVPPSDQSAVLATLGELRGNVTASYAFTMTSLLPGPDGTLLFTGYSVITTHGGTLYSADTGILYLAQTDANGLTPFVTTAHLLYGTKEFHEVDDGAIVASGKISFATGQAAGTYTGTICR